MDYEPGWYPYGEIWRYHNGTDWTDHLRQKKPLPVAVQKARNQRALRWIIPVGVIVTAGYVAFEMVR